MSVCITLVYECVNHVHMWLFWVYTHLFLQAQQPAKHHGLFFGNKCVYAIWVVCCSVLQCVAVCCSVLQCVAVCCSVLQCVGVYMTLVGIYRAFFLQPQPLAKHHGLCFYYICVYVCAPYICLSLTHIHVAHAH